MAVALASESAEENRVTGKVYVPFRGEIDQAVVQAVRRSDGVVVSALSDNAGDYQLTLPAGLWSISVLRGGNSVPFSWLNEQQPDVVRFFDDGVSESIEINYDLSPSMTEVSGFVRLPDGSPAPFDVDLTILDVNGRGITSIAPANSGFFFAAAGAGDLTFSIHLPNDQYFVPDPIKLSLVNGEQINLGTINLVEKSSLLTTTIVNPEGAPVSGINLLAWQTDKRATRATSTINGQISLPLSAGDWWIVPQIMADQPYLFNGAAISVTIPSTTTLSIDPFVLEPAPNNIIGRLEDSNGDLVEQSGSVVAFHSNGDAVRSAQIVSGTYSIYLPDGSDGGYTLQPRFAPDSLYTASRQTGIEVENGESVTVNFSVAEASSAFPVGLWDPREEEFVQNLRGNVYALNGGNVEQSPLQANGQFMLDLSPGNWSFGLDYSESNTHLQLGNASSISIQASQQATVEIPVAKVDSAITGRVLDPSGNGLPGAIVHAYGLDQEIQTVEIQGTTDSTGRYYIQLPHGTYQLWSSSGGPNGQSLVPASIEIVTLRPKAIRPGIDLSYKNSDVTVSGQIYLPNNHAADAGTLIAYTAQGGWITTTIQSNGTYSLPLVADTEWTIEASQVIDQTRFFIRTQLTPQNNQSLNLTFAADLANFDPKLLFFDPAQTTELIVEPNFSVVIPAGAIPALGPAYLEVIPDQSYLNSYHRTQIGKGYRFILYDAFGAPIGKQFLHNVMLVYRYDKTELELMKLSADKLIPGSRDNSSGAWSLEKQFVIDQDSRQVVWEIENLKEVALFSSYVDQKSVYLPMISR
ncbi:MAG: carboxypeptidase-like regulatory domain-containing protein [Chloroflexota bacterium]